MARCVHASPQALGPRERAILQACFGLGLGRPPETLDVIGRRHGVSRELIRQIEARAFGKLRTLHKTPFLGGLVRAA
ncbi:MAG: hypothetical protein OXF40_06165 [Rhodospirillales bacterium]|nr:hypothetical protein [Rhodospirillales bacterium]